MSGWGFIRRVSVGLLFRFIGKIWRTASPIQLLSTWFVACWFTAREFWRIFGIDAWRLLFRLDSKSITRCRYLPSFLLTTTITKCNTFLWLLIWLYVIVVTKVTKCSTSLWHFNKITTFLKSSGLVTYSTYNNVFLWHYVNMTSTFKITRDVTSLCVNK